MSKTHHYEIVHIFDGEEVVRQILEDGSGYWLATFRDPDDAATYLKTLEDCDDCGLRLRDGRTPL